MDPQEQKIHDIINKLYEQIHLGYRSLWVAKYVNQAHDTKRINCAHYFFEGTYYSCLESAFLALSRVLLRDDRGKPVNIWYLLNCLQGKPDVFNGTPPKVILKCVDQHLRQLEAMDPTIKKIEEQRHSTIAHLDKAHINKPQAIYQQAPIEEREFDEAYKLVLGILNTYTGFYRPTTDISHLLNVLETGVTDDLDYVIELIENDNKRPEA
jgi:hypothetical protein